jgi:hypothetical protein
MQQTHSDVFTIDSYRDSDEADMIALWQLCGLIVPRNNPLTDIARKTADSSELFFIGRIANRELPGTTTPRRHQIVEVRPPSTRNKPP